ncbi:MAG: hypothetical protein WBP48_01160, partial [Microbacterium sp.]
RRVYEAFAVNAVGLSRASVQTTAWAYDPPAAPAGAEAVPEVAGPEGGVASLTIGGVDTENTVALQISSPVGETRTVAVKPGQPRVSVPAFRVGANTATPVTVTPVSRYEAPPGISDPAAGAIVVPAHGIGAPTSPVLTLSAVDTGDGRMTVTAIGTAVPGGDGATVRYGIVPEGKKCETSVNGSPAVFEGLAADGRYTFVMCAESWFDSRSFGRTTTTATVSGASATPTPAPETSPPGGTTP